MSLSTIAHHHRPDGLADFRVKTTLWIALSGLVFLAPFGIFNLLTGSVQLGAGAIGIVVILAVLAYLSYRGRQSTFSLVLFPPVLLLLLLSIREQGVIGIMWTYPAILIFYFIFREKWAWVANTLVIVTVVPVSTTVLDPAIALRAALTLIVVSAFSIMTIRVLATQQKQLEEMAVTDSLTGLLNRSLLIPSLEQALDGYRRTGEPATLLTLDLDHFKYVNDTFGHAAGDAVLTTVADVLTTRLRPTDKVFRTGGEEFSILLPDTDVEPGHHVAQLLRSEIAGHSLVADHVVTVSVGAARLREDDSPGTWFARADKCLYEAKHDGRNRVVGDKSQSRQSTDTLPADDERASGDNDNNVAHIGRHKTSSAPTTDVPDDDGNPDGAEHSLGPLSQLVRPKQLRGLRAFPPG